MIDKFRRTVLQSIAGFFAALLFPWRKAKASWAYEVTWVPDNQDDSNPDQTSAQSRRIARLLRENAPDAERARKLARLGPVIVYKVSAHRVVWTSCIAVVWSSRDSEGVVYIEESIAAEMSDQKLFQQLQQGFLQSLYKKKSVIVWGEWQVI